MYNIQPRWKQQLEINFATYEGSKNQHIGANTITQIIIKNFEKKDKSKIK